ncbi:MAG TPA: hypothetical protein VM285_07220 [Polyangia bacterium]|nr:hypothetical protein [Polyangia bacterium]
MTYRSVRLLALVPVLALVFGLGCGCGSKKTDAKEGGSDGGASQPVDKAQEQAAAKARNRISVWLGEAAGTRVSAMGKEFGKQLGLKLSSDPEVLGKFQQLATAVLADKKVKQELKVLEDKATEGFSKKLTLGWKALTSGGIDAYKQKVTDNTKRVASEVIAAWVKDHVMKDERFAASLKRLLPVLKLKGMVAALSLQDNMSPAVSKKVFVVALKLAASGDSDQTSKRVEEWTGKCDGLAEREIETLFTRVTALDTLSKGVAGLVVNVLGHETTKRELAQMVLNLAQDHAARPVMIEAYENAAFEKGDPAVRASIEKLVRLEAMDRELFAALERIGDANGAPAMIERHLTKVGEDPKLAAEIEGFVIRLISACGDLPI